MEIYKFLFSHCQDGNWHSEKFLQLMLSNQW